MPPLCPDPGVLMDCSELSANIPVDFNCALLLEDVSTTSDSVLVRYQGIYLPGKGKIVFTGRNCASPSTSSSTVTLNYGCRCSTSTSIVRGPCACDGCLLDETAMESIFYTCKEDLGNNVYRLSGLIRGMTTCGDPIGNAAYRREHLMGAEVQVGVRDCTWDYLVQQCSGSALIQDCGDVTDCVNNCLLDPTLCMPNFCTAVLTCLNNCLADPTTCLPNFCTAVENCSPCAGGSSLDCATLPTLPDSGDAVPGVTRLLGSDCNLYTIPAGADEHAGARMKFIGGPNQAIPFNVYTKATWNSVVYDDLGEMDTVNSRFVASVDGRYLVTAWVSEETSSNPVAARELAIIKNGTTGYQLAQTYSHVFLPGYTQNVEQIVDMLAGDYIEIWFRISGGNGNGTALFATPTGGENNFSVQRLQTL